MQRDGEKAKREEKLRQLWTTPGRNMDVPVGAPRQCLIWMPAHAEIT